ncbi:hypothetical protein [Streptomyces acidiscabies]|uniref:hypothetical protein n=1 Tax=Streptomyces acidiscabies TaxID=42234 RepID=UPI0038F7B5A1
MIIDNKVVATTVREWVAQGKVTSYFVSMQTLDAVDKSEEDGRYLYSGSQAFGKTRTCKDSRYKQELYTSIQFWDAKNEDADSMKRLIVDFTDKIEKMAECAAGVSE